MEYDVGNAQRIYRLAGIPESDRIYAPWEGGRPSICVWTDIVVPDLQLLLPAVWGNAKQTIPYFVLHLLLLAST